MAQSAHIDPFARENLPPPEQMPEFRFTLPELQYPARLNCAVEFVDRHVEQGRGDRPCIVSPSETLGYAQFAERVNRIANVLVRDLGMQPGTRVLLRGYNGATMSAAFFAVMKAGGIAINTMPLLRGREIAFPLKKAKVALALCDIRLADEMKKAKTLEPGLERIVWWGEGGADSLAIVGVRIHALPNARCVVATVEGKLANEQMRDGVQQREADARELGVRLKAASRTPPAVSST